MKNITLYFFLLFILSCNEQEPAAMVEPYRLSGDTVVVDAGSIILPKLRTEVVEETAYLPELISGGTVKAIPNYFAEIVPPFSGRVSKVYLRLGMKTRPGTPLFEIASPGFTEIQTRFLKAKSEWESARVRLSRQNDLYEHGVAAKKELEEAQSHYRIQQQEYENAAASLQAYGVDIRSVAPGKPLVITSPIAGEVIKNEIVLGHYLREEDEARVSIAQLNKVWVTGEIKEKDLAFMKNLTGAEITLPAYPQKVIPGTIYHIDDVLDPETRSIKVHIECNNDEGILKPEMFVNVKLMNRKEQVLMIPAQAVLQLNDKSFVFAEVSQGRFIRRVIETGMSAGDSIIVANGIEPGERIITEGAFYLLEAR